MDKNSITGLILIGLILFGFTWYDGRRARQFREEKARQDSIALATAPRQAVVEASPDSLVFADDSTRRAAAESAAVSRYGAELYAASHGEEREFVVENGVMKITFSNLGGKITAVELKDYTTWDGRPLMMFEEGSSKFDVDFWLLRDGREVQVNTAGYYFESSTAAVDGGTAVSMKLPVGPGAWVEYLYTVPADDYMVGFDVRFHGMSEMLANQSEFVVKWGNVSLQNEKSVKNESIYTNMAYMFSGDKSFSEFKPKDRSERLDSRLHWVAFRQKFFSSVFIAGNDFQNGLLSVETFKPETGRIKEFAAELSVPMSSSVEQYDFSFYYGPNKYSVLKRYDIGLNRLIPLGWGIIGWINRWFVIPMFDFLSRYIASFGWIILIMTIVIKLVISPLTYKSYMSMAKTKALKPELDALNEKYPRQEDALKKQQATMELYKRAGVNPMGGCLPLLIQMPVLIAMFRFFPVAIELRGQHFLWADDLSSYDSILNLPFNIPFYGDHVSLFTLLMAVSLYFTTKIMQPNTGGQQPAMVTSMNNMMLYLMPVMMLFFFNDYASGLCYYYLLSNIISLGQNLTIRKLVDEDKIRAALAANAKKPQKKSRFQKRYEELMRQQQETLRQQQKQQRRK